MPTDIFPDIDIPVISVVWNYPGLPPEEMEKRIVSNYERSLTTTVNDIEHIESQSLYGVSVVKIFFQPGAKIEAATAQVTAISQTAAAADAARRRRRRSSSATAPRTSPSCRSRSRATRSASSSSSTTARNFIRADIATVQGAQIPWPYGGKQRQIMIDIDPPRSTRWGLSPRDVNNAIGRRTSSSRPARRRSATNEYPVVLNAAPTLLDEIGDLPIKTVNGTTVYIARRRQRARRLRAADEHRPRRRARSPCSCRSSSTGARARSTSSRASATSCRRSLPRLPKELKVTLLFDQSIFVRAAVAGRRQGGGHRRRADRR